MLDTKPAFNAVFMIVIVLYSKYKTLKRHEPNQKESLMCDMRELEIIKTQHVHVLSQLNAK